MGPEKVINKISLVASDSWYHQLNMRMFHVVLNEHIYIYKCVCVTIYLYNISTYTYIQERKIHICTRKYVYIYIYIHTHIYIYIYKSKTGYIYVHMHVYIYIYIHMCVCVCVHVCVILTARYDKGKERRANRICHSKRSALWKHHADGYAWSPQLIRPFSFRCLQKWRHHSILSLLMEGNL